MTDMRMDTVIVGGGSAGLSAALLLGRMRRHVLVLDQGQPRNRFAAHMHGVLGRDHTSPLDLLADGRRELDRYGIVVRPEAAAGARLDQGDLVVVTDGSDEIRTRRLLVATGMRDELPEIEGLAEQWGRGVAVCPYCDGWEVRDQRIGVLITSPRGAHQAQLLRQLSERVTCFTNGQPALDAQQERELTARGIGVDRRSVRRAVSESGRLVGLEVDGGTRVGLDAVFVAPTPVPQDTLLVSLGAQTDEKFGARWVVTDPTGKTTVPGVWAAGNVADPAANVPLAMAAGATAAGAINADLIDEDTALAVQTAATPDQHDGVR